MISATAKGIIIGLANVVAVSIVLGVLEALGGHAKDGRDMGLFICLFGSVPGIMVGSILGHLGEVLVRGRFLTIALIAMTVVFALGIMTDAELVIPSCAATAVLAYVLERWTRANLTPERLAAASLPLSGVRKGVWMGAAAVVATAFLVGVMLPDAYPHHDWSHLDAYGPYSRTGESGILATLMIAVGALVPALLGGALLGRLADALSGRSSLVRLGVLVAATYALVAVPLLAYAPDYVLTLSAVPAIAPALIAAGALERWTRGHDRVPLARARSRAAVIAA